MARSVFALKTPSTGPGSCPRALRASCRSRTAGSSEPFLRTGSAMCILFPDRQYLSGHERDDPTTGADGVAVAPFLDLDHKSRPGVRTDAAVPGQAMACLESLHGGLGSWTEHAI